MDASVIVILVLIVIGVLVFRRESKYEDRIKEEIRDVAKRYNQEKQEREKRLREFYKNKCLTPTITKLFQDSGLFHDKDVFQEIIEQVEKARPQNTEEETFSFIYILTRIIETCLLSNYDGILNYDSKKIAEDMIGHPERDYEWLSRFSKMKKRI